MINVSRDTIELRKGEAGFPWRLALVLGRKCPDVLYLRGNQDLLGAHAVSFCGARNASEKGVDAAFSCASRAVEAGFIVTSGNARGVDRATHRAALECGGATILVLPEGIDRFRIPTELADVWDWDRVLVMSQFDPRAIWRSYQAMQRNSVIMGLSCGMIVVEAAEKGGTRAAGEEALRLKIPLFAIDYGFEEDMAPGNRVLISKGAYKIRRTRESGLPNLKTLIDVSYEYCRRLDASRAAPLAKQIPLL